jgi:large subunit ribosomal protein L15
MIINDITAKAGRFKARKRVGRGEGSGHGKQSGKGHKGASSRSGYSAKQGFEGGQMKLFRRMAKFGFTNVVFKTQFWTVNLGDIISHPNFIKGGDVNTASLIKAGLVRDDSRDLKILGGLPKGAAGVKVKLNVTASRVSESVTKMVTDAGGSVLQTGTRRDKVRGVDPMSDDKTPKNLTKKLRRSTPAGKKLASAAPAADAPADDKKKKK